MRRNSGIEENMFPSGMFSTDGLQPVADAAMVSTEDFWYAKIAARKYYVYLCGPITGLSFDICSEYYRRVAALLPPWIVPLSPMRGKGYLQGVPVLGDTYEGMALASQRGVVCRDFFDVRRADVVLANFLGATRVSIGSSFELAWAFQLQKPVILAMEEQDNVHEHTFVREACAFRLPTLEQACKTLIQVVTPGL
jgi:hypothetical protein